MTAERVVRAWMEAVNALDVDRLLELAHPEVRLWSPRDVLEGHEGVRAFAERQTYGVRMHGQNLRLVAEGDATVLTEDAIEFRSVDDGSTMGRQVMRARWVVRDGRLVEFAPYEGELPE